MMKQSKRIMIEVFADPINKVHSEGYADLLEISEVGVPGVFKAKVILHSTGCSCNRYVSTAYIEQVIESEEITFEELHRGNLQPGHNKGHHDKALSI